MRYLALGDSYTIGEGVAEGERWPVQLAQLLRERGYALEAPAIVAQTGWTTGELSTAIDAASPEGPFELVSLLIGVNNQYRGLPVEGYRREFEALLARAIAFVARQPARVLVLSIPDWGQTPFAAGRDREGIAAEIAAFNAVNADAAAAAGARYIDVTTASAAAGTDAGLLAGDGLHYSGRMYRRWAELALGPATAALAGDPVAPRG
ncbi:MAG: GDSL-type esterase/lipase family protein [Hyphomicrobiales bacterium]